MTTPRDAELRRIESEITGMLRRVKRTIGERARSVHPELGPAPYILLGQIISAGPLRAADLVGTFDIDKGGVSRGVQHLVDLGLVERQPDPEDRRAQLLAATKEGSDQVAAVLAARRARFDERLSSWSDADITRFADQLADYNRLLSDD